MDCDVGSTGMFLRQAGAAEGGVRESDANARHGKSAFPASNQGTLLLGCSPAISALSLEIERAAAVDVPVLISGERGAGKEFVARAIHGLSPDGESEFVGVDCAALQRANAGSSRRDTGEQAPAGGDVSEPGLIESAKGGVLFLDGTENLPGAMHAPILDLLRQQIQSREREQGSMSCHVRIIAATRLSIAALREIGELGERLGHPSNAIHLHVPALRERKGDVAVLATHFMRQAARDTGRPAESLSPEALALLEAYDWPGNVRELFATVQRAVVLCDSVQIEAADLGLEASLPENRAGNCPARPAPGTQAERDMLVQALRGASFNITRTAQGLSVSRVTLYRMLRRNHLVLRHDCVGCEELEDGQELGDQPVRNLPVRVPAGA